MEKITFRTARREDVPAILGLLAEDPISAARQPVSEGADAACWRAFDRIDADPDNALIVAELHSEVVGTCQLTFTPGLSRGGMERMTIEAVHVRADQRGRGTGGAMMRWAVDRARERGCGLVQLTTDNRRADAHRFYERLGFAASHVGMKLIL